MDREFKRSLSFTYLVLITCFFIFITLFLGMMLVQKSGDAFTALIKDNMMSVSNTAASMIDGDSLRDLGPEDEGTPEYEAVMDTLTHFRENVNLDYIYCIRDMGDGTFTFGMDPTVDDPAGFGNPVVVTDALIEASKGTPSADSVPYTDNWGTFYSSYSPVFDSDGNVAGIVAADFNAEWYEKKIADLRQTTMVTGVFSLIMGLLIVYVITRKNRKEMRIVRGQLEELAENVDTLMHEIGASSEEKSKYERRIKSELYADDIDSLGEMILAMTEELHGQIDTVRERAYLDGLTGVSNKTSYLDKVAELEEAAIKGDVAYAVAVFDLNGLKEINDNHGHECGDLALADAACVLASVYGKENVYRIGGDEFIAVMDDMTEEGMKESFAKLDAAIADVNTRKRVYVNPLGVSKGYAIYTPETDTDYNEVFRRADFMMYDDKEAYYLRMGDRRRRNRRK